MLAISRFRYAEDASGPEVPTAELGALLSALQDRPGFRDGYVGRAVDDQQLWVLESRWESVGAYRRALSAYDVKVAAAQVMQRAVSEPSAYEILVGEGATTPNVARSRGAVT